MTMYNETEVDKTLQFLFSNHKINTENKLIVPNNCFIDWNNLDNRALSKIVFRALNLFEEIIPFPNPDNISNISGLYIPNNCFLELYHKKLKFNDISVCKIGNINSDLVLETFKKINISHILLPWDYNYSFLPLLRLPHIESISVSNDNDGNLNSYQKRIKDRIQKAVDIVNNNIMDNTKPPVLVIAEILCDNKLERFV